MENTITASKRVVGWWIWLLAFTLAGPAAVAQSGPYGNEWIVPNQPYYKVKVTQTGLHRLDYNYLTKAGISGIDPSRLQLWRRGRQVAVYQGGNPTVFDANTYFEFYGQRNDGQLDRDLYKKPTDQPHQLYSFYTDTAAYFLTYPGPSAPAAKRMAEPVAAGGTPHAWRLASNLKLETEAFADAPRGDTFLPWLEPGEGFFSQELGRAEAVIKTDSALLAVLATGPAPAPSIELKIVGATFVPHNVEVSVLNPATNTYRTISRLVFKEFESAGGKYPLQRAEIGPNGLVTVKFRGSDIGATGTRVDNFRVAFMRVVGPQANRWLGPRRQLAFATDSLLGGPATYEVDSIPASVVGYDIHDPWNVQRVAATAARTLGPLARRFVFPSATAAQSRRVFLADVQRPFVPIAAQRVRFRTINQAAVNFAIISHRQLYGPATDDGTTVPNAAKEYAKYRASTAGGRFDTLLISTVQLYDQFHYGEKSWLAMRHLGLWLAAGAPNNPERYLLLLGKGIVPAENGAVYRRDGERGLDLVPTSSRAVSDNMLTADFQNDDFVPKLRTGRLTVTTPQQIMNYLGKLRTHNALGPEPWRKNVLHLVGSKDADEAKTFPVIMNRNKARVERPLFGGKVTTYIRDAALPVRVNISAELNEGISLMTYFGHGSNNTFSLNFGSPSDPTYQNPGKYPLFYFNGCAANHTFTSGYTVVEDWLFAEKKGALGSLGEYGFSYPDRLEVSLDTVYKLMFNNPESYGKPITAIYAEAVKRLQNSPYFTDDIGIEQLLGTGWQGDPVLSLYAPEKPDFIANSANLSITPTPPSTGPVRAGSPDFVLNVGVTNPGKVTTDPLEIKVTRTVAGKAPQVYSFTRRQAWTRDTVYALVLPNSVADAGLSTFQVVLDPNNKIAELSETNNTAQFDFTFLQGGLAVVAPTEFAILSNNTPRLVVQNNNRSGAPRDYDFELDTIPTFNSGIVRRSPLIRSGLLAEWGPTLPSVAPRDSVVWYWRARFHAPEPGEDGGWVTSSFRVIPGSPGGWSQSHYGQLQRTVRTGVDVSAPSGAWTFVPTEIPIVLRTTGGGVAGSPAQFGSLSGAGIFLQNGGGVPSVFGCGTNSPNLLIAVYEPGSLRPVTMPSNYQRCGVAPNSFYYFSASDTQPIDATDNLNLSAARQQELAAFLAAIPVGSYVALVSVNRLQYSVLPAALKTSIQNLLGSQLITKLADGEPLALIGQKLTASTGRLVREIGPDGALATPGYNQGVELRSSLQQSSTAGRVVSPLIGPAKEWQNLFANIRAVTASGVRTLSVVAVDETGAETVVLPNVTPSMLQPQSLASVQAAKYPYLRLELALRDDVTRVPPQLRQWLVTYQGVPEGVVRRDLEPVANYAPARLQEQATTGNGDVTFNVRFQNVSNVPFLAPLKARVQVRNTSASGQPIVRTTEVIFPGVLAAGATATIPVTVNMKGLFGALAIEVFVNPRVQPEQLYTNNELLLEPFTISDANLPPTLDVAFDGRHILNGEIVSPTPIIAIQLSDEDRVNTITDRTAFTLSLQKVGSAAPVQVDLNASNVQFSVDVTKGSVAKLEYRPGLAAPLADGKYTLRVQGRDPRNAAAGAQDFQVNFEVVNDSEITNVYPYPNPVTNKARFVFTVTGQQLPTNMKIQIMTITGRVVREIFMNELGPLHIGNNITDFAWDGTDSFGDRLANGTYLYRVSMEDPTGQFGRRKTAGDRAFKNDWGKLVLMR